MSICNGIRTERSILYGIRYYLDDMEDGTSGLLRLGLTEYEAKTYIAIISLNTGSISEICTRSSVPRSRTYDVLARLQERGLVERLDSTPIKYKAQDPKMAIEDMLANIDKDARCTLYTLMKLKKGG